jgi:hypothetical protein
MYVERPFLLFDRPDDVAISPTTIFTQHNERAIPIPAVTIVNVPCEVTFVTGLSLLGQEIHSNDRTRFCRGRVSTPANTSRFARLFRVARHSPGVTE